MLYFIRVGIQHVEGEYFIEPTTHVYQEKSYDRDDVTGAMIFDRDWVMLDYLTLRKLV